MDFAKRKAFCEQMRRIGAVNGDVRIPWLRGVLGELPQRQTEGCRRESLVVVSTVDSVHMTSNKERAGCINTRPAQTPDAPRHGPMPKFSQNLFVILAQAEGAATPSR